MAPEDSGDEDEASQGLRTLGERLKTFPDCWECGKQLAGCCCWHQPPMSMLLQQMRDSHLACAVNGDGPEPSPFFQLQAFAKLFRTTFLGHGGLCPGARRLLIKKELERLEKNKARRQAREQQKELHQKTSTGDAGPWISWDRGQDS
ncbi:uncharacterized protein CPUR_03761 [Claviceps purpurea 20.1]|uniref:Uncharacterized protein n=1 Tax=Claviceps purpurea (strain 20.1) TaxID=1111077 RepID=M1WE85_CLAP2|nr:hypothetical protein E4U36_008043 [Claviceps purpurea]CCE29914.1 uncharacterized protein CPUR_03761 [Claviceps purpurea 20.1]